MREKKEKKPQRFQEVSTEGSALSENGCKTVIVDTETGVHYLHIKCGYSGSITPLYNADGTLVVKIRVKGISDNSMSCRSAEDLWQNIVKAPQEY